MAPAAEAAEEASSPALPSVLTHYYREHPLRTLSDLDDAATLDVLGAIAAQRDLDFRLTQGAYLPRRREIEEAMRAAFVTKGGRPVRANPHYFVLGTFSLWEGDPAMRALRVRLDAVPASVISFTYTDSFFAFNNRNLRGVEIPSRPYHQQVYTLDELPALVRQYGLPAERWRDEPDRIFDVYVEAQVWDDEPLCPSLKE